MEANLGEVRALFEPLNLKHNRLDYQPLFNKLALVFPIY